MRMIYETLAAAMLCVILAVAMPARPLHLTPDLRVVDGDTIAIGARRIRLSGFDTPETWKPQCEAERLLGELATQRLRMLIASPGARLWRLEGRDAFGRELARLEVGGEDAGAILIREGLAHEHRGGRRKGWCGA